MHIERVNLLLSKLTLGTLTHEERWELEKASLDDPFLTESLEGYYDAGALGQKDMGLRLHERIEQQEAQPEKRRTLFSLRWISVAASLILLVGVSFWIFSSTDADAPQEMAASQSAPAPAPDQTTPPASPTASHRVDESMGSAAKSSRQPQAGRAPARQKTNLEYSEAINAKVAEAPDKSNATKEVMTQDQEMKSEEEVVERAEVRHKASSSDVIVKHKAAKSQVLVVEESGEEMSQARPTEAVAESTTMVKSAKTHGDDSAAPVRGSMRKEESSPTLNRKIMLVDGEGRPLPGVEILTLDYRSLGKADRKGAFDIPDGHPYVIAAIAGYDSLTVATGAKLSVEMQESGNLLGQRHLTLIDQMDDTDLINHYRNELNNRFSRRWPICTNNGRGGNYSSITISIIVNNSGGLDEPIYFGNVDDSCQKVIGEILERALDDQVFSSGRPVDFMMRINL